MPNKPLFWIGFFSLVGSLVSSMAWQRRPGKPGNVFESSFPILEGFGTFGKQSGKPRKASKALERHLYLAE